MGNFIKGPDVKKRPFYLKKRLKRGGGGVGGGRSNPLLFFHTEEKLFNMKYICGKYSTITTVLKMHKFCHSGAKPFSKGKDVSKNNYSR